MSDKSLTEVEDKNNKEGNTPPNHPEIENRIKVVKKIKEDENKIKNK